MPEILTESFCERCGTRYTFESAAPRKTRRIGQIRTLSKGMKNWVMSDDTSLDEAMAAARNDQERDLTSHQLDAFHSTFNFCMTCRQYTCGNCWNTAEGHCLTCAPHLGQEILQAPFPDQAPFEPVRIEAESWPEIDLSATAPVENGNGHPHVETVPGGADPWAAAGSGEPDEIADFDPTARLAFLSGETLLPPPVAEPEEIAPSADAIADLAEAEVMAEAPEIDHSVAAPPASEEAVTIETAGAQPVAAEPAGVEALELAPIVAGEPIADDVAAPAFGPFASVIQIPMDGTNVRPSSQPIVASTELGDEVEAAPVAATEPLARTVDGKAEAGLSRTADLLRRFRPGQNIDAELAAYEAASEPEPEPVVAAERVAAEPEPEPIAAEPEPIGAVAEPEPEPLVAVAEPEPIAAEPEPIAAAEPELVAVDDPEPEPVAVGEPEAESEPEPVAAAAPEPQPAPQAAEPAREDTVVQPTWRIFAPDQSPTPGQPSQPSPSAPPARPFSPTAEPQWPARADIAESPALALLTNRANRSSSDGLWAASAQEVLSAPVGAPVSGAPAGVQPCSNCGLSLSATARFCRRCGSRQG